MEGKGEKRGLYMSPSRRRRGEVCAQLRSSLLFVMLA